MCSPFFSNIAVLCSFCNRNFASSEFDSLSFLLLPPKAPFSTWPWEQTSCLLCELRVNFSLPGSFWILSCTSHCLLFPQPLFGLVVWVETTTILLRWCWCLCQLVRMIPPSNRVRFGWTFLPGQRNLPVTFLLGVFNFLFGFYCLFSLARLWIIF